MKLSIRQDKIRNRNLPTKISSFFPAFALFALFVCNASGAFAREEVEYCDVYVGTQKVFSVSNTNLLSAVERGGEINDRIKRIIATPSLDPGALQIRSGLDRVPVILLGTLPICEVTAADAASSGESAQEVAKEWLTKLGTTITSQRKALEKETTAQSGTHHTQGAAQEKESSTLSEHAVLLLFIEIAILLFASLALGELMVRLGQPAIIGQILAGLLLGQTVFGNFFPDLSALVFPQDNLQSKLIEVLSWVGVSFILMLTGMETDTSMLKRLGKPALYFALVGLIGPLIVGGAIAYLLPASLIQDQAPRLAFAVFLGTVFAASSVPVVARILMDMKLLKNDIGQLVLSASLSHDLICCLLLAVIAVLSGGGGKSGNPLATATIGTTCFLLAMYLGRPVFFLVLRWVNDKVSTADGLITAMVVLLLSCAAITQALGVHIVLGAFAAGVILSLAPVINTKVVRPLELVTMGFFAPIFFASAGLNVNLSRLLDPQLALITFLLSIAAIGSKMASCYIAGNLAGLGTWESLSVGVGANTKGSMGLILAMLGYSLHIITVDMFAIAIFISLLSTGMAPGMLKWTLSKVKVTDEEKDRIAKADRRSRTILHSVRRVLWPTTGDDRNTFIAKLLNSIGKNQVLETVLFWVKPVGSASKNPFAPVFALLDKKHVGILKRTVESDNFSQAIADEANRGYDMVVMATAKPPANVDYVFGEIVDDVILKTPSRVLVLYEPEQSETREIKKVLIPVSGSGLSISAGEFGITLAKSLDATVTCLCIEEAESIELYGEKTRSGEKIQHNITLEVEGTLTELAQALDVGFQALLIQSSAHAAQAIILTAQQQGSDLIVLGAQPKLGKKLFLGHTINFVLRNAPCAVAVLRMQG